jgi:hypothetical protein
MLYCAAMVDRQDVSARLIQLLGGTGLGQILAAILDAAGPLAPIGAQAIYTLEPFLGSEDKDWAGFGRTLEDPEGLDRLIEALRIGEGEEP